jgi:hypothetical protein
MTNDPFGAVRLTFWRCVIVGFPDNERHTDRKPQNYALPMTNDQSNHHHVKFFFFFRHLGLDWIEVEVRQ